MSNQINVNKEIKKKKTLKDRFYEVVAIVTIGAVVIFGYNYIKDFKERQEQSKAQEMQRQTSVKDYKENTSAKSDNEEKYAPKDGYTPESYFEKYPYLLQDTSGTKEANFDVMRKIAKDEGKSLDEYASSRWETLQAANKAEKETQKNNPSGVTKDSCETAQSEMEMIDKGFEKGDTSVNAGRNYKDISNKVKQCKAAGFIK